MSGTDGLDWPVLRNESLAAARTAYAPYSGLQVGAAALTSTGAIVTGCNVENASFGLTLCAECGLVSDLHRQSAGRLVALSVVDSDGNPLSPCGRCRQVLFEAGGAALEVETESGILRLGELLPGAFGPEDLPPSRG